MRRLTLLALLAFGLAACGGSGSSTNLKITFGQSGGTMLPYSVTIAPGGAVTANSHPPVPPKSITSAEDATLSTAVQNGFPSLKSEQCPGTFPDESALFITALGKTVTVRGSCEPGFTKLWKELASAVGSSS